MPHLNELQAKFDERGLSILGVTGESKGLTEPWIEKHEVGYDYAYDKSGHVAALLSTGSLPNAVLVAPDGRIVWRGHPGSLNEATLALALKGNPLRRPLFRLPGYTPALRKALAKGDYRSVYGALGKIKDQGQREELTTAIDGIIEGRVSALEALFEAGDYLAVDEALGPMRKALRKLPPAERLDALAEKMKARDVVTIIRAQRKVRELVPDGKRIAEKQRTRILKELRRIVEANPDTQAARDAQEAIDMLGG